MFPPTNYWWPRTMSVCAKGMLKKRLSLRLKTHYVIIIQQKLLQRLQRCNKVHEKLQ